MVAISDAMGARLAAAGIGTQNAGEIAAGGLIGTVPTETSPLERKQLRDALMGLCGMSTHSQITQEKAGGAAKSGAARAHMLPGAMPLAMGKKVLLTGMAAVCCEGLDPLPSCQMRLALRLNRPKVRLPTLQEPEINGKVAEVMVGDGMPAFADPQAPSQLEAYSPKSYITRLHSRA